MGPSLTPFGQEHLISLARLRILAAASAFVVALVVQVAVPSYSLTPLLILLALEVVLSYGLYVLPPRLTRERLSHIVFGLDIAVVTGIVLYTGGVRGGFATLYVWIALVAALFFGLRWFFVYAAGALAGAVVEVGLETLGTHGVTQVEPLFVAILGQFTLLAVLVAFAYLLTRANRDFQNNMRAEQVELTAQREQAERARRRLVVVNEITTRIAGLLDVNAVLDQVARLIVERFGFDNTSILMNDAARSELVLRAQAGRDLDSQTLGYRQSWEVGLLGAAVRTGETVVANDVRWDRRYYAAEPGKDMCRAELCVPLKHGAEVIGVLDAQSARTGAFEAEDVSAVETLADQIAVALENARLLDKASSQLEAQRALTEFSHSLLQTVDRERILDGAAKSAAQVLNAEGALVLLPEGAAELIPRAVHGWENTDILALHVPLDRHSLPGTVMLTRAGARWSEDEPESLAEIRPLVRGAGYHSGIAAPMLVGGQAAGVILVNRRSGQAFSDNESQMLSLLANQTAIALERVRLYVQTKREAEVKAALLRELSHRVKNNLAAISTLLCLARERPPERREEMLDETLARVQSMIAAHTLLSRSDRAQVSLRELGAQVLNDAVRQLAQPGRVIEVTADGDGVEISPREITTLTLVLNELATNAVRHGLAQDGGPRSGKLQLRVEQRPPLTRLIVEDNGPGFPDGFDLDSAAGLGLSLVRTLVEKDLRGRLDLERGGGWTRAVVSFKAEE